MLLARKAWFGTAFAATVALAAAPAFSQAWIGQIAGQMASDSYAQCMQSSPLPENEIDEARIPARAAMQSYWQRASAGTAANITGLFQQSGQAEWALGNRRLRRNGLRTIQDPLAQQSGLTLPDAPIAFARGIHGGSARGLWAVRAADGTIAGHYLVDVRREQGEWRLARIEVLPAPAEPPAVNHYCARPGDIDRYNARYQAHDARIVARKEADEAAAAAGATGEPPQR